MFSKKRKFSQQPFTRQSVPKYQAIQEEEASVLLQNLLDEPAEFDRHIHQYVAAPHIVHNPDCFSRYSTAIFLNILFGRRILSVDDPYMQMAEDITPILRRVFRPSLLDISRLCTSRDCHPHRRTHNSDRSSPQAPALVSWDSVHPVYRRFVPQNTLRPWLNVV